MGQILILGGSGYVGQAFQAQLRNRGVPFTNLRRAESDYAVEETLLGVLRELQPEFVINAAGYTGKPNVDACETDKGNCLFGNAVLPDRIRRACESAGVPWGHVSSGCIYTGTRPDGSGFREDDPPNFCFRTDNCSFYSGTKALGEEVLAGALDCYVWRLRIPFNEVDSPRNYLTKLMRYERLLDAVNSISQLDEFAAACLDCWTHRVPFGAYNVTNPGAVTAREVVELIKESGVCRKEFRFFESEEEFMRTAAITPRSNCVLDTTKLEATGIRLTPVREAISEALRRWRSASERKV